jgi:hypothetical protein
MDPIMTALRERSRARAEVWTSDVVKELPDPFTLKERAVLGSYSYALLGSKHRIIREDSLLQVGPRLVETPSTVARDYLYLSYGRGPKVKHEQIEQIKKTLKPYPVYARPGGFDHGLYIDIKATFWEVVNIAGWDVDYYPNKWISAGRAPIDFPFPKHKQARSCLVSVARPGMVLTYKPDGKFPTFSAGSPIINLSISKLISDLLNSIAAEAIALGAVYANTDGYIAPCEKQAAQICQMILDWGLEPRIKAEGPGSIKSAGAYKVGDVESIPFGLRGRSEAVSRVYAPKYKGWLKPRFSKLSGMKESQH